MLTNANDSYARLEKDDQKPGSGVIDIHYFRAAERSELWVTDHAQGMDKKKLQKVLGTYGGDTSGQSQGYMTRGLFGRGLKDAMIGLGEGDIQTIRDGFYSKASLGPNQDGQIYYQAGENDSREVSKKDRDSLNIQDQRNGTVVHIRINRENVTKAQSTRLKLQLPLWFSLRDICGSGGRQVRFTEVDKNHKPIANKTWMLEYQQVEGITTIGKITGLVLYEGVEYPIGVTVRKSPVPLDGPDTAGLTAPGGFLIKSQHGIQEIKSFGDDSTKHLLGEITCPGIDTVAKADNSVIKLTRDGLEPDHNFTKALYEEIARILYPYLEKERQSKQVDIKPQDTEEKKKMANLAGLFNEIAHGELEEEVGPGPSNNPNIPSNDFAFVPQYYDVLPGDYTSLVLRGNRKMLDPGTNIQVSSDNARIELVDTDGLKLEERPGATYLVEAKFKVESQKIGQFALVTAKADGYKADAMVAVIGEKKSRKPANTKKPQQGGIINKIQYIKDNPDYRTRINDETRDLLVYMRHPTIRRYCSDEQSLNDTIQGQVLLAELVLERLITEVITRKTASGQIILHQGSESNTLENEARILRNKHGSKIHALAVSGLME